MRWIKAETEIPKYNICVYAKINSVSCYGKFERRGALIWFSYVQDNYFGSLMKEDFHLVTWLMEKDERVFLTKEDVVFFKETLNEIIKMDLWNKFIKGGLIHEKVLQVIYKLSKKKI